MITVIVLLAVCFLAYANGANDNFKGVASLFGSGTTSYRTAISWATVTTFAGSVAAIFLAEALVGKFSGKGLVPDALTASPPFLLAVALGAGAAVILATLLGFPVSTTHGLIGSLVGAGTAAAGPEVDFAVLGQAFVLPLLVSPLLAIATGACVYGTLHRGRIRSGITRNTCVCGGLENPVALPVVASGAAAFSRPSSTLTLTVGDNAACAARYDGRVFGVDAGRLLDGLHLLSAGAVSFARGLNDTPKIAALLFAVHALDLRWGLAAVASAMAIGGLLNARKVADTMSHRLTSMNPGQGFAANLSTAALVTTASLHGLPVSTTHVSVGALLGMGLVTRQTRWKPVVGVLAAWVVTLPCAALLGALAYVLIR
ncbi:inorganic phosphate transporter [Opitutus terrae]|uniref:Phosphate transporter n=1 Tax=Opitutus terrae (strain DSM 11246 / JCM 15787 / PB90-1) TaxID=452637 RepID=B1ZQB3_OPITP|nr:inorganic phosphate transporter [Opitutus terrae]ACB73593.1 phosphate transporter [Opitutus terrae PB90-1]